MNYNPEGHEHHAEGPKRPAPNRSRSVDVIIITYQSATELETCLSSLIRAAPRSNVRVLTVDNGSSDDSADISKRHGATVVRSKENLGFAAAVNRAARQVTVPYMLLLNPDTVAEPGAIDRLIDAAEEHLDRSIFGARTIYPDGSLNPTSVWGAITLSSAILRATGLSGVFPKLALFNPESLPDWDRSTSRAVDIVTGCVLLVRTEVWLSSNGFDPRYWLYGEETEWQMRLQRSGHLRGWFVAESVFQHDKGDWAEDTPTGALRSLRIACGRATYMRQHWPLAWRRVAWLVLWLEAMRHGIQGLGHGYGASRHRILWQQRRDWIRGYAPPS